MITIKTAFISLPNHSVLIQSTLYLPVNSLCYNNNFDSQHLIGQQTNPPPTFIASAFLWDTWASGILDDFYDVTCSKRLCKSNFICKTNEVLTALLRATWISIISSAYHVVTWGKLIQYGVLYEPQLLFW